MNGRMMIRNRILLSATLIAIFAVFSPANAAYIIGAGVATSCGKWTALRKSNGDFFDAGNWVLGYASGAATASGKNILSGLDSEAVFGWLDNYCAANPLTPISDAALAFVTMRLR
jgi:hypothetical protein